MRRLAKYIGIIGFSVGAALSVTSAFAYTDTTPGSGASVSASTVAAGGSVTFNVTMNGVAAGDNVTFSAVAAGGCTVSFSPASAALSATHQASTTATFSSGCAGQNVTLVATGPAGQTVSAAVAVSGGFPNTASAPVPFGWIVMGVGAALILFGILGVAWRRNPGAPAAA